MRPPDIPADDLYVRLELPVDAAPEAIEIAWRALLKRHHPDVAGESSLEAAKRINVAHDWLADPVLRARYDRATRKSGGSVDGTGAANGVRSRPGAHVRSEGWTPRPPDRARRLDDEADDGRPADLDLSSPEIASFLDRIAALNADDIDRLSLADAPPIAFVASIRRFLAADRVAALDALAAAVEERFPATGHDRVHARDAATSYGQHLVLAGFLADELSAPFAERVEERMTRGWQAAVGHGRYGPQTAAVRALLTRAARLTDAEGALLATDGGRLGVLRRPWPPRANPQEDEALRVSAELAAGDAAAVATRAGLPATARDAVAGFAHVTALGSTFGRSEAVRLLRPWRELDGPSTSGNGARRARG
jgi:curved DNA-binding protein CbpA